MNSFIVRCQLVASEDDILDYHNLVFKVLEENCPFGHKYCLVTVFPNWQSRIPTIGETGFLHYDEVIAGDTYYNRNTDSIMKYNFSNFVFKKFIKEVDNSNKDIVL